MKMERVKGKAHPSVCVCVCGRVRVCVCVCERTTGKPHPNRGSGVKETFKAQPLFGRIFKQTFHFPISRGVILEAYAKIGEGGRDRRHKVRKKGEYSEQSEPLE